MSTHRAAHRGIASGRLRKRIEKKTNDMLEFEYARSALRNGLAQEAKLGVNPFKFGLIGATDAHTSLATTREDNFFGKNTPGEPAADRWSHVFMKGQTGEDTTYYNYETLSVEEVLNGRRNRI